MSDNVLNEASDDAQRWRYSGRAFRVRVRDVKSSRLKWPRGHCWPRPWTSLF